MKKKARFSRSAMPGPTRTTKVLICVALCLSVVAVVFSQWRPLSSTVKLRAFSVSAPVPSPTIPPPTSPSKEYIYAGGRLIATEEGVNLSPTVSVTSPTNNFTFTSGANLPIVVTAADTDGTISQVQIYQGTTLLGAAASGGGGIYNYSWTSVAAGSYALTARATDNGGAITTSSIINVISNAVPTVSVTSPANNFTFTSGSNLPIVVSAADADGTISQVQMYQGATLLGAATSGGGGIYNYSWTSVAAGSYALTARATDNSGAITSSSIINVISNTNAPPTVNIWNPVNNFTFVPGANLGIDVLATDTDGTISQVQIYRGATLLGQATSSGDGIYNYSWNNVAAGSYALTARATDNSGAITASSIINVNSNAVPTVSIGSPANNYVFNSGSNLPIVVSAADADGSISQVQIYRGATLLGAATSGGGGVYNYSWTSVAAGSYALTARATDNSGAITASSIINVISNAIPTVSVTSPANNFIFTSGANLPISVSAADTDGTISQVQIYQGATLLGAATSGGGGTYNYSWNNVAAGSYALTARATDNRGAVTTSVAVTVISNAAPTVIITSPANNFTFNSGSNLPITVTAADADGTISQVQVYRDGVLLGAATLGGGTYNYSWNNVAAGSYALTARATDNRGAVTTSVAVTVISNALPTVSITSPANNFTFNSGSNLPIAVTAADTDGTISQVQIYRGATLLGAATSGGGGVYNYSWTSVAAGSYALTARATDNRGAITASSIINVVSNAIPTVSVTSPANNFIFTSGANLPISVSAADTDGTISQVQIYQGATLLGAATSGGGGTYNYSWNNVAAGSYALTARATDNRGAVTTSVAVTVISNAAPTVGIASPANNSIFTAGSNLQISVTAADATGTISRVDIYQGTAFLGQASPGISYLFLWSNVPAGTYALTAKATDNHGAVTTSAVITVISNVPPTASIMSPANNSTFTAGSNLQINTTAADANGTISRVDIYQGATFLGQASSGISYLFLWNNVPAGTYALTARATDNHGAITTSTAINISSTVGFNGGRFAGGNPTLTAMNLVPDGRLFVCRQTEQLKNGAVLPTPFISPAGNSNGEPVPDGTLEPGVASNRFVCVYSASTTSVHNRVSRFTATEMWRWLVAT